VGDQNNVSGSLLRVAFDTSVLGYSLFGPAGKTGVYRMVYSLAKQLEKREEIQLSFCASDSIKVLYHALEFSRDEFRSIPFLGSDAVSPAYRLLGPYLWDLEQLKGPSLARRVQLRIGKRLLRSLESPPLERKHLLGMDVYHSGFYPLPKCSLGVPGLRRFLTVCDIANLRNPEFAVGGNGFLNQIIDSISPDDHVIAISQTTKDYLCELRSDLTPERVSVVPLAASSALIPQHDPLALQAIRAKYALGDSPFLLCVSTLDKRKNLGRLLEAFHLWILQQKDAGTLLVLAGFQGNDTSSVQQYLSKHSILRSRVILPGFIPDADLRDLYSAALAFIYPSLEEGFGLPVLEAMQCGLPVATSQAGALEELVGKSGVLFDPTNPESIAAGIHEVLTDSRRREGLRESGLERAKQYSWAKTADRLVSAYST
jgi:glycosyltransferase involved in cell wall biosynthesis